MQPLPNIDQQSTPSLAKTNPKTAAHWVFQLVNCFPPPPPPGTTQEVLRAITLILCQYREETIKEIVNPVSGMPTAFKYLPSLKEIKDYCDNKSSQIEQDKLRAIAHEKLVRTTLGAPQEEHPCYKGPIEDVKPGDVLHWSRLAEYDHFAKSKLGFDPGRPRGFFEKWIDTGRRPFVAVGAIDPVDWVVSPANHSVEKNPFE